ncbi:alpha-galactosidase, partial [bacterium]|nr:alpha-galactosidase [bacterium]
FPHGIKPIADYVHKKGMLFGLYAEIERAGQGCKILEQHPDWQGPGDALKINDPEVAKYVEKEWRRIIEDYDLDLFRLDFNAFGTKQGAHTPKDGFSENNFWRYYENFFGMVDRIRKDYPDVIFQQCSIGGARNDLATVGKFDETYLTDGLRFPRVLQSYSGQSLVLPPEILVTLIGADGCYSVGTSEDLNTYFRATFTLGTPFIFEGMTAKSLDELNPAVKKGFLKYSKIYKNFIRPILPTCKVYHHGPVDRMNGVDTSSWFAMEFASPSGDKGWAMIAKIGGDDSDEYIFKPRGLDPGKSYEVTIDSMRTKVVVDGFSLYRDGIPVHLDGIGHSELLMFEEK